MRLLKVSTFIRTIIETDAVWIVERKVPNQKLGSCAEQCRVKGLQILQHLGIPETFSVIDVGNSVGLSDVPNSGISSGGDPQVLLETRDGSGGTGLVLQVAGRSPGVEVGFQNFGSEVVIKVVVVWVVSMCLKTLSAAVHSTERRKFESPGSMPPALG